MLILRGNFKLMFQSSVPKRFFVRTHDGKHLFEIGAPEHVIMKRALESFLTFHDFLTAQESFGVNNCV